MTLDWSTSLTSSLTSSVRDIQSVDIHSDLILESLESDQSVDSLSIVQNQSVSLKIFYDLTEVHILSRVIKSFPWAELHFEYNISTESCQTLLQPAQTLCIVWAGCLYVPVEEESRTSPFVETLDSNIGFTMCKHFIIPGKHRLMWDDKTTFEDTIRCWVKGERATETCHLILVFPSVLQHFHII